MFYAASNNLPEAETATVAKKTEGFKQSGKFIEIPTK